MAWRVAKSLLKFREQINALYPRRKKTADGTIGDAAHQSRSSDHNPWVKDGSTGVVTAFDFTHDPTAGCDAHGIAEYLRMQRDSRIKYVISNSRIFSATESPWNWRRYTGSNPHSTHVHISVKSAKSEYDSERVWNIGTATGNPGPLKPPSEAPRRVLRLGMRGEDVATVQQLLAVRADGHFGPITEAAVKGFQREAGLVADGIVGAQTWHMLDNLEQIPEPGGEIKDEGEPD